MEIVSDQSLDHATHWQDYINLDHVRPYVQCNWMYGANDRT